MPVEATITTVTRAVRSFHPRQMPRLSRVHYRQELLAWMFLPMMVGAVEGTVVGVVAKNAFAGVVAEDTLNFVVAILTGAQAFANVTSFFWASVSHGRHKIRFAVGLQLATVALVAMIAFAPHNALGLLMLVVGVVGARVCWSGVTTLRSTVWRANYPRTDRARMAGKLATVQAIVLAGTSVGIGVLMSIDEAMLHVIYPAVALCGVVGTAFYSRLRVRGHRALVRAELAVERLLRPPLNPLRSLRVLRSDRHYDHFMACQFVFGLGNLMVTAPLVIMFRDRFGYEYLGGILLGLTIPVVLMSLSIPFWARLLDRVHIVHFRSIHSWAFVASSLGVLIAAVTLNEPLLWVSAGIKGIAFGGGVLAWNLGHHDFAPRHQASQYMGVHLTLTGIRGLMAPLLAVALYESLLSIHPDAGPWVFAVCVALSAIGAIGFSVMARSIPRQGRDGEHRGASS